MTRSRRKEPITGITCAKSEKDYKIAAHRSERRTVRTAIASGADQDDRRLHQVFHDPWDAPKDGKVCWTGTSFEQKAYRK